MGSWNHTCAISNLHIRAYQDVVVFLLLKQKGTNDESFCYGNALYDVVPLPFYGKYNDYGGVEECHGFGLPIIMETLKARLYKFGQGPNESHDCEVTPENLTIEKLFEADHENRLGIQDSFNWSGDDYDRRELEKKHKEKGLTDSQKFELDRLAAKIKKVDTFRQVTHVVIHNDIFKSIMEKWYIEKYVGENKGTTGYNNSYNNIYFKDVIASIPDYVSWKKSNKENYDRIMASDDENKKIEYYSIRSLENTSWDSPNHAIRMMGYFKSGGTNVWGLINVEECVDEYVENKDWDGLGKFAHEVLTASWINSFMSYTRKIWTKQSGSGSQNSEPLGYRVLAKSILDILDAEQREYGEYDNEDNPEQSLEYVI